MSHFKSRPNNRRASILSPKTAGNHLPEEEPGISETSFLRKCRQRALHLAGKLGMPGEGRFASSGAGLSPASGKRSAAGRIVTASLLLASATAAFSQQPEEIAPLEPEALPPGELSFDDIEEPPLGTNDEILLDRIRTLVFYGDPDDTLPPLEELPEGIVVRGLDIPREQRLRMVIEPFLEGPLTLLDLERITRRIVIHYRAEDFPVVDAIVPEQDITDGVVRILILEGRITALRNEGNEYFANALLRREIRLRPGERIRGETVRSDIEWLNRNPFRQVDAIFTPGETPGETELILMTEDRPPVRLYLGYENTGHPLTQRDRWLAGFNWGNAFGWDHQLNYQVTISGDFDSFRAHSVNYVAPLPWRHLVTFYGSYIDTEPSMIDPLELSGTSWQLGTRYTVPLPHPPRSTFRHELRPGIEFKSTNTNLAFGGDELFDRSVDIAQGILGYEATWSDPFGQTFTSLDLFYSPGGITSHHSDEVFNETREGTSAEYFYARLRGERETALPWGLSWIAEGSLQVPTERLFFSEQLGIGGYRTVRGYVEREATGDSGFFFRNDLHLPDWRGLGETHRLNLLAFADIGEARIRSPRSDEPRSTTLAGVGAGIRYRISRHFLARFDLAFPLRDGDETDSGDPRLHIGVTASW